MAPGFISELESRTGVAIVTSLQAFFWLMLREAGVADQIDGYGTLFRDY
jgi:maleate cis-trans isomerase